jgi:predicted DNA-binding transcriptional regulator YafY
MAKGMQIVRCYRLIKVLLQGQELDRHAVAKLLGVRPAAADKHINAIVTTIPGVEDRRKRHRRTIRFVGGVAPGVAPVTLCAAACFGASLARLFRGTPYETRLDEVRESVTRRARKSGDFDEARRKFLFITPTGEFALQDRQGLLDDLVEAVLRHRRVHFEYTDFAGESRSVDVSPWSLAIYDHQLYLIADGESAAPRAYRLSRIGELRLLPQSFKYPGRSTYDPEQMFRDTFGIFLRGEDPVEEVVLRLAPRWRTFSHTHLWHSSQQVTDAADGGVAVRMRVRTCKEFEAFILGFGGDAEVLEPVSLRERIARQAEALHQRYESRARTGSDTLPRSRRTSQTGATARDAEAQQAPVNRSPSRRPRARGTKTHTQAQ